MKRKKTKIILKKKIKIGVIKTLYRYSSQDCVILVEEQIHRSMEPNRKPRDDPIKLLPTRF